MRILFMGTPDFAVPCLQRLIDDGHDICGVFSQPDKPKGRGYKLLPTPVKTLAQARGIPVFQPAKLRDGTAAELVRSLAPELIAVVAYGRIIPDEILFFPKHGTINIHGSLLPKYRGAAPIQWTVLNGDKVGGVTCAYLTTELDSGDIIAKTETEIGEYETSGELFERLSGLGAELLGNVVFSIENGTAARTPQNAALATPAPMLDKTLSRVDFSKAPREIINLVRGLDPWPVAKAELSGASFKLFKVQDAGESTSLPDGDIVSADERGIRVACGGGSVLLITELQAEGGRRMRAADYLRGHKI